MEPLFELKIELPQRGSQGILRDLHRQIRAAILNGRLKPGLRLPATRVLAATLGVSRNTAIAAYDLLISEGYLVARRGAATYVASALPDLPRRTNLKSTTRSGHRLSVAWEHRLIPVYSGPSAPIVFNFRAGLPDLALFPFDVWQRLSTRAARRLSQRPAIYGQPQGMARLRHAIAQHVSATRAVSSLAEDVVVCAGAQQAFNLLAQILVTPGNTVVAVEDPGYPPMRDAFAASGATVAPVPVDEQGIVVERLPEQARVICVTPSHQFPLGVAMSQSRRIALLEFANRRGAVVIEDDYDAEFRYGARPLDALQTLDQNELVFYVGTFSKSMFPELRMGFVVSPPWAKSALVFAKQLADWHAPTITQDTLATFIAEGHLIRHLRKMRREYAARRTALLIALECHCKGRLQPLPATAGLHLTAKLYGSDRAENIVGRAAAAGLVLDSSYHFSIKAEERESLIFGFGMIAADRIDEAISRLRNFL